MRRPLVMRGDERITRDGLLSSKAPGLFRRSLGPPVPVTSTASSDVPARFGPAGRVLNLPPVEALAGAYIPSPLTRTKVSGYSSRIYCDIALLTACAEAHEIVFIRRPGDRTGGSPCQFML